MPRKKSPVPTPKHVHPVAKMARAAKIGAPAKRPAAKPKPRVRVGSPEAVALGIRSKDR